MSRRVEERVLDALRWVALVAVLVMAFAAAVCVGIVVAMVTT